MDGTALSKQQFIWSGFESVLANSTEETWRVAGKRIQAWEMGQTAAARWRQNQFSGLNGAEEDVWHWLGGQILSTADVCHFSLLRSGPGGLVKGPWLWKLTKNEFSSAAHSHSFERLCLYERCFNTEVVCSNLFRDIFRQEAHLRWSHWCQL